MKTIGVIGGLGPETTSEFYLELVFGCYEKNKEERPPILIWNIPLRYEIEKDLLEKASGEERYIPYLIEAAKKLEKAGADFLVIPCNSVHVFINEVRNAVKIPVLSILEETAKFLKNNKISKVGLLATPSTVKRKIYENHLKNYGIKQILPDDFDQAKIGKMIKNIVLNRHNNKDRKEFINIINKFEDKNVENVILACTDLQILIPQHPKLKIYDTMKILADSSVNEILK